MEMGPGFRQHVTFFKIKEGKIIFPDNTIYDTFKGIITDITLKESELTWQGNTSKVKQWNVTFTDGTNNYVWSANYDGYLFQGFINSIASMSDFEMPVTLVPYKDKKTDQTKMVIYSNEEKLGWKYGIGEMPAVNPIVVDGEEMKDAKGNTLYNKKPRMAWVTKVVESINKMIRNATVVEEVAVEGDKF